ncbi:MAG: bifunctional diaminohydroxyphosphoribosylaminopyrimidine deaminase/5-amino-6-(5-phosphoribosylamino)uracil reductase RibD [Gammaproteobacteria bacterium]
MSANDHRFMARALQLAERGLYTTDPNPRVGCVLVKDGAIIGEGWHERAGGPHAEVMALKNAGDKSKGATAYVTLEPCAHTGRTPPCADELSKAGVARVVYAGDDPNPQVAGQGAAMLKAGGIEVATGVCELEAAALNPGFFSRWQKGRPFVRSKIAVSLDGRTALASGESQWITGEAARNDVQHWRARSSVILTGAGTVLADNPRLTVRRDDLGDVLVPKRVVLDSSLQCNPQAELFKSEPVLVYYTAAGQENAQAFGDNVELKGMASDDGRVSLSAVMGDLAAQEINEVLVEAGPTLNGALLSAGFIDELIVYQASHVLGDAAKAMFAIEQLSTMSERTAMKLQDVRRVGDDLRLIYRPQ